MRVDGLCQPKDYPQPDDEHVAPHDQVACRKTTFYDVTFYDMTSSKSRRTGEGWNNVGTNIFDRMCVFRCDSHVNFELMVLLVNIFVNPGVMEESMRLHG